MNDFTDLIKDVKVTQGLEYAAVIVGGGSYGGMLSAWMRMKYPQWVQGALAASAPIRFFEGAISPNAYDDIATSDFAQAQAGCADTIKSGFNTLANMRTNSTAY